MRKSKNARKWLIRAIVLELVILISLSGYAYGKYVTQESAGGNLQITAELGKVNLQEHQAVKDEKGQYDLNGTLVQSNAYTTVLPGLDIPKDPYVTVTEKSPIPAYLFVEVWDNIPTTTVGSESKKLMTYTVDTNNWKLVGTYSEKSVYVYTGGTGDAKQITANLAKTRILADDTVYVSQYLKKMKLPAGGIQINFRAVLKQCVTGKIPADVYNDTTDY